MKKLLIMAVVAGFALTSCTNDEADLSVKQEQGKVQISFAPPVNYGMTRTPNQYGTYEGPKFGSDHTVVFGEMTGTKYDICQNFTVFGRMYEGSYSNWASSSKVFGTVTDDQTGPDEHLNGRGSEQSVEVSHVSETSANGWFPQYPYFFYDGYKYAFGAVSPKVEDIAVNYSGGGALTYDGTGLNISKYKSDVTVKKLQDDEKTFQNHFDLMYADRIYDVDRNYSIKNPENGNAHDGQDPNNGGYNGVNMKFHHALASVHFKVCIDPAFVQTYNDTYGKNGAISGSAGADVTSDMFQIKSIKIINVRNTGDFAQTIDDKTTGSASENTTGAPAWTFGVGSAPYAPDQTYEFLSSATDNSASLIKVGVPLYKTTQKTIDLAATDIVNQGYNELYGNPKGQGNANNGKVFDPSVIGRYALVIPQTFDSSSVIEIEYDFVAKTGAANTVTKHLKKTINLTSLGSGWEMGKKYTYVIAFRGDLIYFAPQIEDWDENVTITFPEDPQHPDPDDHIVL